VIEAHPILSKGRGKPAMNPAFSFLLASAIFMLYKDNGEEKHLRDTGVTN
jgi:hypothetical protein